MKGLIKEEKVKRYLSYIGSGILLAALGILFIAAPASVVKIGVIAFGVFNIIESLTALGTSFRFRSISGVVRFNIVKTLINLFISILVVYFAATSPGAAVAAWVVWLIALNLLLTGLSEVCESYLIRKSGYADPFYYGSSGWLYIVFAVLMFLFPNFINSTLLLVVGVVLITSGIFVVAWAIKLSLVVKEYSRREKIAEAEWSEKE